MKPKMKVILKDNIYDIDKCNNKEYKFNKVVELKPHEWGTYLSGKELADMWIDGDLIYYPETQRGVTLKRDKNGNLREVAVFDKNNINEIKKAIINGEYYPDQITLNLLEDGDDIALLEGDELELHGKLCILDGQHRIKALSLIRQSDIILNKDRLSDLIFPIKISNYKTEKAQEQFYQYTKGLKINKSRAESFNRKDGANRIVTELSKNGALKGLIDTNNTVITKNNEECITTFNTLKTAIEDSFGKIEDEEKETSITMFLKDFFQLLMNIFPEMKKNETRKLSNEYNLICENFTMYGYMELAQMLYCKRQTPDWKNELEYIRVIDFNKFNNEGEFNPIWETVFRKLSNGKPAIVNNKTNRAKFRSIIKEQFFSALYR